MAFYAWYASNKNQFQNLGGAKGAMKAASEAWKKVSPEEKVEWKAKALGLAKKADGQGQQPNEAAPHGEEPQQAGDTICSGGRGCLIHRNNMLSHRWMRSISALTGHYF